MNKVFPLLYFILLGSLSACNKSAETQAKTVVVEKTDRCVSNPEHTYEVYIPARTKADEKLPLLIIIDAHGGGKFALDKFKYGANQYPVILVASNLVKNGFAGYERAIHDLAEDVHRKYPANETTFVTGFSGGARMALAYALKHPVGGLIMCGALANTNQIKALHCPVISISGMDDFNFVETAQYLFNDQAMPNNLKIELTNASHSWPDSLKLANAVGFLSFTGQVKNGGAQIEEYCQKQQARIDALTENNDYLKAALIARNMATISPFNENESFSSTYKELKTGSEYNKELTELSKCLKTEMNARQPYLEAFNTKDSLWWKNEIKKIEHKIESEPNPYRKDMFRRIKAFWGIACYSLSKHAAGGKDVETMNKLIPVYRILEPGNSEMLYYSAFPYYWNGNNIATVSILKKAIKAGFSDMNRLNKDFSAEVRSGLAL